MRCPHGSSCDQRLEVPLPGQVRGPEDCLEVASYDLGSELHEFVQNWTKIVSAKSHLMSSKRVAAGTEARPKPRLHHLLYLAYAPRRSEGVGTRGVALRSEKSDGLRRVEQGAKGHRATQHINLSAKNFARLIDV
jgi:hypothetical protein